jgi:FkbM family methyltransferase
MSLSRLKKLKIIKRNQRWLSSNIPLSYKLPYYWQLVVSYLRLSFTGSKHINYLGKEFHFDSLSTPFTLQLFPHEIHQKITNNVPSKIRSVLDIGGNIGQFSYTFKRLFKSVSIDVFEPNPEAFGFLQKNVQGLKGIRAYNYGLGGSGKTHIYYEAGRSSIGSLLKSNAGKASALKKVPVLLTNQPAKLTGKKYYDLIKIDVEGYEYEVITNLKGVSCRYMFIELSGPGREKSAYHSRMFTQLEEKFGPFNIIHAYVTDTAGATMELLISFVGS